MVANTHTHTHMRTSTQKLFCVGISFIVFHFALAFVAFRNTTCVLENRSCRFVLNAFQPVFDKFAVGVVAVRFFFSIFAAVNCRTIYCFVVAVVYDKYSIDYNVAGLPLHPAKPQRFLFFACTLLTLPLFYLYLCGQSSSISIYLTLTGFSNRIV